MTLKLLLGQCLHCGCLVIDALPPKTGCVISVSYKRLNVNSVIVMRAYSTCFLSAEP